MNDGHDGTDDFDAALTDLEEAFTDLLNATHAACCAANNVLALVPPDHAARRAVAGLRLTPATVRAIDAYLDSRDPGPGRSVIVSPRSLAAALGGAARALTKGARVE